MRNGTLPGIGPRLALVLAMSTFGLWAQSAAAQDKPGRAAMKAEYAGWRQYMTNCARCHGDDAVGGVMAPDLRKSVAAAMAKEADFHATVSEGRPARGMPSFKGSLDKQQIDAIFAYLRARASGDLPAGRPRQS